MNPNSAEHLVAQHLGMLVLENARLTAQVNHLMLELAKLKSPSESSGAGEKAQ